MKRKRYLIWILCCLGLTACQGAETSHSSQGVETDVTKASMELSTEEPSQDVSAKATETGEDIAMESSKTPLEESDVLRLHVPDEDECLIVALVSEGYEVLPTPDTERYRELLEEAESQSSTQVEPLDLWTVRALILELEFRGYTVRKDGEDASEQADLSAYFSDEKIVVLLECHGYAVTPQLDTQLYKELVMEKKKQGLTFSHLSPLYLNVLLDEAVTRGYEVAKIPSVDSLVGQERSLFALGVIEATPHNFSRYMNEEEVVRTLEVNGYSVSPQPENDAYQYILDEEWKMRTDVIVLYEISDEVADAMVAYLKDKNYDVTVVSTKTE